MLDSDEEELKKTRRSILVPNSEAMFSNKKPKVPPVATASVDKQKRSQPKVGKT